MRELKRVDRKIRKCNAGRRGKWQTLNHVRFQCRNEPENDQKKKTTREILENNQDNQTVGHTQIMIQQCNELHKSLDTMDGHEDLY